MGLLDLFVQATDPARNQAAGLLMQKVREIPGNARAIYRGLLNAPSELSALASPEMASRVRHAMTAQAPIDRDKAIATAMDFLQTAAPVGGLLGRVARVRPAEEISRKMADMGLEGGWYRGGPVPKDGKRTGPWYTRDRKEAESYARRFGEDGDVREYAIPSNGYLRGDKTYAPRLAHDIAAVLDDPYFGKPGAQLAGELRSFGPDERVPGAAVWQALEARFGSDGAAEVVDRLGHFKGATGMTAGPEAYVFKSAPVRDARRAAFNPDSPAHDLYGKATLPAMLTTAGIGAGGLLLLRDSNRLGDEDRKR